VVVMRLLIRHGFSRDMADLMLDDFRRSIEHLQKHPGQKPLTAADGTAFTHHGFAKTRPLGKPTNENR
jgi:glutamate decarboxylase